MVLEDHVVVINAAEILVNPTRADEKIYYRHSGYPGGLHGVEYQQQLESHPDRIVRLAVRGMLPKNKLRDVRMRKLKVYAGSEHPHQAQQPRPFPLEA
jgi:large subunit ribosomal protein L13